MAGYFCPNCRTQLQGTEHECPKCGTKLTPALTSPGAPAVTGGVEIRRYPDTQVFRADAGIMAAAGWNVIAQSESSRMSSGTVGFGLVLLLIGLLFWPLLLVGLILIIAGFASRSHEITVTYRYDPQTDRRMVAIAS